MNDVMLFTHVLHVLKAATIAPLLRTRRPSHVAGLIVAVVVRVAVKAVRWTRAWSDVSQEYFERFFPLITHRDAAPTVVSKLRILGSKAPILGRFPCLVFGRQGESVFARSSALGFALPAAATSDAWALEDYGRPLNDSSAIAATSPSDVRIVLGSRDAMQNSQAPNVLSSEIKGSHWLHSIAIQGV